MKACRLALKILVATAFVVSSFVAADLADAQSGDELDTLNQQFTQSYQVGTSLRHALEARLTLAERILDQIILGRVLLSILAGSTYAGAVR